MQRGFTLIELLVLLAIVGIVAVIIHDTYQNYTNGAVINQSPEPQGAKIVPDKPTQ